MKKTLTTFLILSLILFTAIIKNSTKKIDEDIFIIKENLRGLKVDLENNKLEFEYLSSTEKLLEYQNLYFEDDLIQRDINEIDLIYRSINGLQIKKLKITD
tara:strand:- start:127 stop:429 length:303 start_codon:yes stop_codon:yes gene_type:complete